MSMLCFVNTSGGGYVLGGHIVCVAKWSWWGEGHFFYEMYSLVGGTC